MLTSTTVVLGRRTVAETYLLSIEPFFAFVSTQFAFA
jgi:hypothetical protein